MEKLYISAYLMLEKDNEILCLKRQGTGWMDGFWSLPAGHVEPGESVVQGLLREAQEEVGITLHEETHLSALRGLIIKRLALPAGGAKKESDTVAVAEVIPNLRERQVFFMEGNTHFLLRFSK